MKTPPTRSEGPLTPISGEMSPYLDFESCVSPKKVLFPYQHLPCCGEITCLESAEIDPGCDLLPKSVSTIPMCGATPVRVEPSCLMSQHQFPHNDTPHIVDRQSDVRWLRQVIRYPRLRIERIRIVGEERSCIWQQCRCSRDSRDDFYW